MTKEWRNPKTERSDSIRFWVRRPSSSFVIRISFVIGYFSTSQFDGLFSPRKLQENQTVSIQHQIDPTNTDPTRACAASGQVFAWCKFQLKTENWKVLSLVISLVIRTAPHAAGVHDDFFLPDTVWNIPKLAMVGEQNQYLALFEQRFE